MYKIHQNIEEVELNIVSPLAIKKYQQLMNEEVGKSTESIEGIIHKRLSELMNNKNQINAESLIGLVKEAVENEVIKTFDIYVTPDFALEWVDIIFKIKDKDRIKENFDAKFDWGEFMRGFGDFFSKLKPLIGRSMN